MRHFINLLEHLADQPLPKRSPYFSEPMPQSSEPATQPANTIDGMVEEYRRWIKSNNLPEEDGYELINSENLTDQQHRWLKNFIDRWEEMQRREDSWI